MHIIVCAFFFAFEHALTPPPPLCAHEKETGGVPTDSDARETLDAEIAHTSIEYTQQAEVHKYARQILFKNVVPYLLPCSFANKPDALKALMRVVSQEPIMEAIFKGQIILGAGDRFMYVVAQGLMRDPPEVVAAAMHMVDPATFALMQQQYRTAHHLAEDMDVGVGLCAQLKNGILIYNGMFGRCGWSFFFGWWGGGGSRFIPLVLIRFALSLLIL